MPTATSEAESRLYNILAGVPQGHVITYGQLASLCGMTGRARWVGYVLKNLPKESRLPWHRVINAQGRISFPAGSPQAEKQAQRLRAEGIDVSDGYRIDLKVYGYSTE